MLNTESLVSWMAGDSHIPYFHQTDVDGVVMRSIPAPFCSGAPGGNFTATIPNQPYLANLYWLEYITTTGFDVSHRSTNPLPQCAAVK